MRKSISPPLPDDPDGDNAMGDLSAPVTTTRGLLLRLREYTAMFMDMTYWSTDKIDHNMERDIKAADALLVYSNPKRRKPQPENSGTEPLGFID
jgi:hypothetical protein